MFLSQQISMPKSAIFSEPFSLNPNGKEKKKKKTMEEISDCVNSFCKRGIQMAPAQKRSFSHPCL